MTAEQLVQGVGGFLGPILRHIQQQLVLTQPVQNDVHHAWGGRGLGNNFRGRSTPTMLPGCEPTDKSGI